ncbi:hypothetical protein PLESTB_000464900 [Pleodorina starrii]|uniref:Apyrase n=1 Tax=Pleodorina starrii TaxID=330485 RepID=A0A9W6F089_9CHLO|nr:hypothetical protein PLESTM_000799400 [Pleodorina starrii]GLC51090.1 hypothetical protein PLESTB_000464900 [Pleodorina starrii]GLC63448.1 hypothetical protein PLESTF_000037400 [Pleodorina starrii]
MGNRRGWLLLCLATTAVVALLILLQAEFYIDDGLQHRAQGDQYAVYIDGGSSGTRVRVFRYRPARWPSYVSLMLPEPSHSVEPGLSAYATQPTKAAASLGPLLEFAYEHVPVELWPLTPVRLLATAGLRLLSGEEQAAILTACQQLLAASRFLFQPDWATVIGGEMEGLFGWAAVNYITGALQEASGHAHHARKEVLDPSQLFTGLLEMGGASMQVTFLPPASAKLPEKHGSHLHLPGVPARLFTHSYLGLGMDSALARAAEYTLKHQPRSPVVSDPCLPIGYVSEDGRHGNGSFAQCLAVVQRIMPDHNCSIPRGAAAAAATRAAAAAGMASSAAAEGYADDPAAAAAAASSPGSASGGSSSGGGGDCVLQGSYVPPLAGRFVAVENFAWTARALGLPENATLRQLRENGRRYCSTHWSSLHAEFSGHIPDQFLVRYCFGAAYILTLLHQGFGLGLDDGRLLFTNTVREGGGGAEVGLNWVLGAAVVDAMVGGGGAGGGRGSLSWQQFWQRDDSGMTAAGGGGPRGVLLLPLVALAALAAFLALALLRASRGAAKSRIVAITRGGAAGAAALFSGRRVGGGGEERERERGRIGAGVSRGGSVSTAWSSSSLVSDGPGPLAPAAAVKDAGNLDPGLASSPGGDVGSRGQAAAYAGPGLGPGVVQEGGPAGIRHGGVLKAAALIGSAARRNPSYTSLIIEGGSSP